ncbi:MAG: HEPN domain-containing protein [Terriglobia bacterium]
MAKADNDLLNIENNLAAAHVPWDTVSFHAQQAAEKLLKAYLVYHGRALPRTHDLARISHHAGTLLGARRKGGASAPPKPRLPPLVRPAPPTACGCKLWGARDSETILMGL